jgi:phenylpropionate dioxygenase-like ring-hydroxylating dioxygenase large terminal subunit
LTISPVAEPAKRSSASSDATDMFAPIVRNAWYVVGLREEFDRTLKQRWILGNPVCFFEANDGEFIVLDDRCAHRRFPLSLSTLQDDDSIQCRYHGFTYASDGHCTLVPGGGEPRGIGVRKYPAVQRGPFIWIWGGDNPEDADETLLPYPDLEDGPDQWTTGYYFNDGNYSLVFENLLDLTHLHYLHGIGGEGFTQAKLQLLKPNDFSEQYQQTAVGFRKEWDDVMGMFSNNGGDDPSIPIHRRTEAVVLTPGYSCGTEYYEPIDPSAEVKLRKVVVPHAVTPANDHETHQWWVFWQNTPMVMPTEEWKAILGTLFVDDKVAVERIQEYMELDDRSGVRENSTAADVAALRIRRTLHRLAAAEKEARETRV